MAYTCQNCGTSAENSSNLCSPIIEDSDSKFCGIPTDEVCESKIATMKYSCDSCGSVSADAEHLCNPNQIR